MKKIIKIVLFIFVGLPVVAFILLLIIGMIAKLAGVKTTPTEQVVTSTPTVIPTVEVPQAKTIKYEVLQQWDINNGGNGKTILIPADYLNEDDMVILGKKLNEDTKNDKNAFIMVFTDKKASELRDKIIDDSMTKDEEKFYDTHYVGQFTKNGNSGLHAFVIYFNGVSGTNSKTIKY